MLGEVSHRIGDAVWVDAARGYLEQKRREELVIVSVEQHNLTAPGNQAMKASGYFETSETRAEIPNPTHELLPGMFVTIRFPGAMALFEGSWTTLDHGVPGGPIVLGPDDKPAFPDPAAGFDAKREGIAHGQAATLDCQDPEDREHELDCLADTVCRLLQPLRGLTERDEIDPGEEARKDEGKEHGGPIGPATAALRRAVHAAFPCPAGG